MAESKEDEVRPDQLAAREMHEADEALLAAQLRYIQAAAGRYIELLDVKLSVNCEARRIAYANLRAAAAKAFNLYYPE